MGKGGGKMNVFKFISPFIGETRGCTDFTQPKGQISYGKMGVSKMFKMLRISFGLLIAMLSAAGFFSPKF